MILQQPDFLVRVSCMTYNHAPYIVDALNGFTMQETTFPFICTIIDDASTDGEQEVIKDYLQDHFDLEDKSVARNEETDDYVLTFARHKTNQNCYFAVLYLKCNHYSIKKSKQPYIQEWTNTKYIAKCEGDDYWIDSTKLQLQVDFLESHPDYIMCSHDIIIYDNGIKRFNKNSVYNELFSSENRNNEFYDYSLNSYFDGWWTRPLSCIYKNGTYLNKIPRSKYRNYRDDVFFYYVLKQGKGALLNNVMAVYRVHGGGAWSSCSLIEMKRLSMNNAFNIYNVEKDRRAFKKILRIQNEIALLLLEDGNIKKFFNNLFCFILKNPFPYDLILLKKTDKFYVVKMLLHTSFHTIIEKLKPFYEHNTNR